MSEEYSSSTFKTFMGDTVYSSGESAKAKSTFQSYVKKLDIPIIINDLAQDVGTMKTEFERKWYGITDDRMTTRRKTFQNVIAALNRDVLKPAGWALSPVNRPKGDKILTDDWVYKASTYSKKVKVVISEPPKDKSRILERAKDSDGNILPIKRADLSYDEARDILSFELGSGGNPDLAISELCQHYELEEIAEKVLQRMEEREKNSVAV
jgi:hypothetical protein